MARCCCWTHGRRVYIHKCGRSVGTYTLVQRDSSVARVFAYEYETKTVKSISRVDWLARAAKQDPTHSHNANSPVLLLILILLAVDIAIYSPPCSRQERRARAGGMPAPAHLLITTTLLSKETDKKHEDAPTKIKDPRGRQAVHPCFDHKSTDRRHTYIGLLQQQ